VDRGRELRNFFAFVGGLIYRRRQLEADVSAQEFLSLKLMRVLTSQTYFVSTLSNVYSKSCSTTVAALLEKF
jgi:hypothetical protein